MCVKRNTRVEYESKSTARHEQRAFMCPPLRYLAGWNGVAFCTFPFHRTAGGYRNPEASHHQYALSPQGPRAPGSYGMSQTGVMRRERRKKKKKHK